MRTVYRLVRMDLPFEFILPVGERPAMNEIMSRTGCHRCGTKVSGTPFGGAIPDHQPPNGLIEPGQPQRLYPHCATCSQTQGARVQFLRWRR